MSITKFLNSIAEDGSSNTARLVCSDWFEENGDLDRAKFIRYQCDEDEWHANELLEENYGKWAGFFNNQFENLLFNRGFVYSVNLPSVDYFLSITDIPEVYQLLCTLEHINFFKDSWDDYAVKGLDKALKKYPLLKSSVFRGNDSFSVNVIYFEDSKYVGKQDRSVGDFLTDYLQYLFIKDNYYNFVKTCFDNNNELSSAGFYVGMHRTLTYYRLEGGICLREGPSMPDRLHFTQLNYWSDLSNDLALWGKYEPAYGELFATFTKAVHFYRYGAFKILKPRGVKL